MYKNLIYLLVASTICPKISRAGYVVQSSPTYYSFKPTSPTSSSSNSSSRLEISPVGRGKVSTGSSPAPISFYSRFWRKNRRDLKDLLPPSVPTHPPPFPAARRVSRISSVMQISWEFPPKIEILSSAVEDAAPPRLRYAYETIAAHLALTSPPFHYREKDDALCLFRAGGGNNYANISSVL